MTGPSVDTESSVPPDTDESGDSLEELVSAVLLPEDGVPVSVEESDGCDDEESVLESPVWANAAPVPDTIAAPSPNVTTPAESHGWPLRVSQRRLGFRAFPADTTRPREFRFRPAMEFSSSGWCWSWVADA